MSVIDTIIDNGVKGFVELEYETKFMFWVAVSECITRPKLKEHFNQFVASGETDTGITRVVVKSVVSSLQIRYENGLDENCRSLEEYQSSDPLHYLVKYLLIGMVKLKDPISLFENAVAGVTELLKADCQDRDYLPTFG